MSVLLVVVTLALAFGKRALVGRLRHSARHIHRVSGGILLVAGVYIVWFWATTLDSGGLGQSSAVLMVERMSSVVTNLLGNRAMTVAAVLAAIIYHLGGLRLGRHPACLGAPGAVR